MRWDVSAGLEDAHGLPRHALVETLYGTPTWWKIERGQGDLRVEPNSHSAMITSAFTIWGARQICEMVSCGRRPGG